MKKPVNNQNDPWVSGVYQTGRTTPPKNHGGLISVTLILLILLGGISSALDSLHPSSAGDTAPEQRSLASVSPTAKSSRETQVPTEPFLAPHTDPTAPNTPEAASFPPADLQTIERRWEDLGISGQAVTPFYQLYYDLPQGIQITALDENATGQGLCLGDILMAINGQPLAEPEDLTGLLRNKDRGAVLTLLIYRENESHTIHFTLGGAAK